MDNEGKEKLGKLITFPGGQKVDPAEAGAGFVIQQTGQVPTPDIIDPSVVDAEARRRVSYVQNQELVKAVRAKAGTSEVADLLLIEISEELAHLKFERRKASEEGKNTANYTIGRITSLKNMMELLLRRKESERSEVLDLKSARFQSLFKIWMEFFYESMEKSGVDAKTIDVVFQQMKADMVDWEKRMAESEAGAG